MLRYRISGNENGEVIIFVNGAGVGPWMWERQLDYFKEYKCITFDLPGHGENSDRDFTTIDDCSKNIEEIIKKESLDQQAIVIGISIGAQITLNMIANHTNVLKKCIVISGLNKSINISKRLLYPLIVSSMPLIKIRFFAQLQAKQLRLPNHMFESYYVDSLKVSKKTLLNIIYENLKFSFSKIHIPEIDTLLLAGEKEKKIILDSIRITNKNMNNSTGYIVKKAGHGIPYEQSDLLNKLVSNFLEGTTTISEDLINI